MALLIGYNSAGLDPKVKSVLDEVVAAIQVWAGAIDGINRQTELSLSTAAVRTGVIVPYGGSTAPGGYLLCDGTAVSRATYADLFGIIGTTFGSGDGSSTFNVPDLRQRFPLGKAASGTGASLGATGGAIDHVHTGPSHTHTLSGTTASENSHTHGSGTLAAGLASDDFVTVDFGADEVVSTVDHTHNVSGTTGAGSAHSHGVGTLAAGSGGTGNTGTSNPPFVALNYIIKT